MSVWTLNAADGGVLLGTTGVASRLTGALFAGGADVVGGVRLDSGYKVGIHL